MLVISPILSPSKSLSLVFDHLSDSMIIIINNTNTN